MGLTLWLGNGVCKKKPMNLWLNLVITTSEQHNEILALESLGHKAMWSKWNKRPAVRQMYKVRFLSFNAEALFHTKDKAQ